MTETTASANTSDGKSITLVSQHRQDSSSSYATKMPTEEKLKMPSINTHTGDSFYLCTVCKMAFSTFRIWVEHVLTHCKQQVAKCIVCNKEFPQMCDLKKHLLKHGSQNQHASKQKEAKKDRGKSKPVIHYLCSLCNEIFTQKKQLEAHASRHRERPYVCTVCGKAFKVHNHLKPHENIHSTKYQCTICGKLNSTNCHLEQHLLLHKENKGYACNICGKTFRWKGDLKRHSWVHTDEKPYQCTVCNKGFTCKSNLNLHVRIHGHVQEPNTKDLPFCNENSTAAGSVQLIMEQHTSEFHDTDLVDNAEDRSQFTVDTFKPKEKVSSQQILPEEKMVVQSENTGIRQQEQKLQPSLNVNTVEPNKYVSDMSQNQDILKENNTKGCLNIVSFITTHTGKSFHLCTLCNKAFPIRATLRNHLFGHCQKNPPRCVICDKVFSESYLKVHLNAHLGKTLPKKNRRKKETEESPPTVLCNQCGKSFDSARSLQIHRQQVHEVPFKCSLCKERFTSQDLFAEHLCAHSGMEQCDLCEKAFATVKVLRQHLFLHKGAKGNRCPLCGKTFLSRRSLRCHINRHIGVENKQECKCNVCGKEFTTRSYLQRHLQVHGEGYPCSVCNKIVKFKGDLKRHAERYCEGKQFKCTLCGKVFKRGIHFNKHVKEHGKKRETKSAILGEDKAVPGSGRSTVVKYRFETENRNKVVYSSVKESNSNTVTKILIPDGITDSTWQETRTPSTDNTKKEPIPSTIIYVINLVDENQ